MSKNIRLIAEPTREQFLIGVFASLGSLLFGYDLGVIAQVIAPGGNVMTVWNPASNDV
jgi:hypothetical protein